MSDNSRIEIQDLVEKNGIEDNNLMIVEDKEDTKRTTVYELKKSFSGDEFDPSENKFYSSSKTTLLNDDLKRAISTKAHQKELDALNKKVDTITAGSSSGKDTELLAARNGKASLSDRLAFDEEIIESTYMSKIKKSMSGKVVDINNHYGYIDLSIVNAKKETTMSAATLIVRSKNLLNPDLITEVGQQIVKLPEVYGVKYTQNTYTNSPTIDIPLSIIYEAGIYWFSSAISFDNNFADKNIKFNITYSDGTIEQLPYSHTESYKFEAKKGFNKISLLYDRNNAVDRSTVTFANIMIVTSNNFINSYIPYERFTFNMNLGDNKFEFKNNNYVYECNVPNCNVMVSYYDNDTTILKLSNDIQKIQNTINDKLDKCGLITDYGTYQFLNQSYISDNEDELIVSNADNKYTRNGVVSKKYTIAETATKNAIIRIPLDSPIRVIETVGIFFFMNKPDFSLFTDKTGGIKIKLCSDDIRLPSETNYYEYIVNKKEMVQGWNFVKRGMNQFTAIGSPNPNSIQFIALEICRTDEMNNKSVIINSLVFNQKMTPTVLMAFNGTYDESLTYLYPYLATRNINTTVFLNPKRTLTPEAVDGILKYKVMNEWDIGTDGCHPNKEILTADDNFRNQYVALRNTMEWLNENMVKSPISYSAPYGNLRPITVPILHDLGYKIAKTEASTCCGFFSEKDFSMPMYLLSNETTSEAIISKIDYAISTNQTVVLYTNDVTEYGSEIDAKKVMIEIVVDYIKEKIKEGELQSLTFKEFYNRCVK